MMRWEYLTIVWKQSTSSSGAQQTWTDEIWVKRPGSEYEKSNHYPADLGNDGWELVSNLVLETALGGGVRGWNQVGIPVAREWMFKRPAEEPK